MSRPNARLRLAFAVTLAGFAALAAALSAAPAVAAASVAAAVPVSTVTTPADALTPLVDCVQDAPLGAVSSRTVVLGYRSSASAPISVAPGSGVNDLTAGVPERGQPSSFEPGEHHGVWLLTVDAAAEPDLAWRLGSAEARFDAAPACTAATAVTVSAPATVAAGATAALTATVSRMLLAAPSTGAVSFTLDGGEPVVVPVSAAGVARADLPVPNAGPHTVTATYQPVSGSGLLPAAGTAIFGSSAPSAPLSIAADSVVAGSTSVSIAVARPSAEGVATVDVVTADGTARAGTDYTALATTVRLGDGQSTATLRVALPARPPGSPASTFFVLLQRASTAVSSASATITLPAVPAVSAAAVAPAGPSTHGGAGGVALASALPAGDPTAANPASALAGADLAMMLGGILLTGGGIVGVVGLVRAAGGRAVRA
ncbi:Calx-beta domain-containing protein [Leifsonia sp. 2TAF2]|uniref:Calx-beta domain-containing protein n=1 Tax=Leifsonia sp. 2TAF2 TaxID=3233009 RepID=UPI003F94BE54